MKDDCREAKASKSPQERFQSALRYVVEEPEQSPQSALRGLLGDTSKRSESHHSALRGILDNKAPRKNYRNFKSSSVKW